MVYFIFVVLFIGIDVLMIKGYFKIDEVECSNLTYTGALTSFCLIVILQMASLTAFVIYDWGYYNLTSFQYDPLDNLIPVISLITPLLLIPATHFGMK
ncbi:MAG: hypothetical protein ACD_67C00124G0004, partial [uncultured bacterium]